MGNLILYEEREQVGIITFNNPDKRNALTKEMIIETLSLIHI